MSCFIDIGTSNGPIKNVLVKKEYSEIRIDDVMAEITKRGKFTNDLHVYGWSLTMPSFVEFYNRYAPKKKEFEVKDFYLNALGKAEKANPDKLIISLPRITTTRPIQILEIARALYCGKSVMIPFERTATRDKLLNSIEQYGITKYRIVGNEKNSITITLDGCN